MEPYANATGRSNVAAFELGDGWITVRFRTGAEYHYTVASAGAQHIAEMHRRACDGRGLNSYIRRYVDKGYETKAR